MIKLWENYYQLNLKDILVELKTQLELNNIYLFHQIKELPDNIMVSCPFHKGGQERRASCGIKKEDGTVHCFTCEETTSLEQMISRCFNVNDLGQFGIKWLQNNFIGELVDNRILNIDFGREQSKQVVTTYILDSELEKYRYYHSYMYKRKLTNNIIEIFDVGYDKDTNCITFPVRDKNGNCLFVARRSVVGKYFNYPQSVEKPVYGIYELYQLKEFPKEIYICESIIDALTVWVYGKYAVALNGLGTKLQIEQLNKLPCRKYILATDNDSAGLKARTRLKASLKNKLVMELVMPTGVKDINDMTLEQFNNCLEIF